LFIEAVSPNKTCTHVPLYDCAFALAHWPDDASFMYPAESSAFRTVKKRKMQALLAGKKMNKIYNLRQII